MRGQGAFEYVLMLSGVLLVVVSTVFILQGTVSGADNTLDQNANSMRSLVLVDEKIPGVWPAFVPPTPADGATSGSPAISVLMRQKDARLYKFSFAMDANSYDYYNSSLLLMLGFDNITALGEGNSSAFDSSTSAYPVALNGPVYSGDAKYGKSLRLDGSDDYAEIDPYSSPNLVPNPSFEDGVPMPSNWSCSANTFNSSDSRSGARSVRLNGSSTNCNSASFPVESNAFYKISYWAKRPSSTTTSFLITDFQGFNGWARGSEGSIGMATQFPANEWAKKEYLVRTFNATQASVNLINYGMNGPIYVDDINVQKVVPSYRTVGGAQLDWSERIVLGNYTQSFNFGFQQQAIRNAVGFSFLHANRINTGSGGVTEFEYYAGSYAQLGGRLTLNCNYRATGTTGNMTVEVRNSTSSWESIGIMSAVGTYNFGVPAKYFPASGPINVRMRAGPDTSMQVSSWAYTSQLNNSPPDAYGYTKMSPLDPSDAFSFEAWVKPQSCTSGYVLSKALRDTVGQYRVYCSSGSIVFAMMDRDFNWRSLSTPISNGAWQHVIGTWNGTNVVLYLNGQQKSSGVLKSVASWPSSIEIGASEAAEHFNGFIDDVRVWDRALSSGEVSAHYVSSLRLIQDGYWQFDYTNSSIGPGGHTYGYVSVDSSANTRTASRTVNG